ncbi:MAG TPA: cytochrome c biogenesis protein ResB, partial [Tepidisphaeraceae bacterium]|nr:cytochrome c biogenesis protein ResB [Tepidisphaeraceae bacterium]
MDGIKKLLKPLASLYLTVALLGCSMLLVYGGTVVQKQLSIDDVQKQFFHSWVVRIPLDPMIFPFHSTEQPSKLASWGVWMLGGYSLIALLLANLFAAHSVRFKLNWKRSGIIAIHLGLIVMLFGEVFASLFSTENQMMIDQGQTTSYTYDPRRVEMAVIDPSAADHDTVTVFDASLLKPGAELTTASLPFSIRIDTYFPNTLLAGPMQEANNSVGLATAGINQKLRVIPTHAAVGTEPQDDRAAAFVTVVPKGGSDAGTYLLTQWANVGFNRPGVSPYFDMVTSGPQSIEAGGKTYQLDLRFKRTYKPYQVTLEKFTHDVHPGTETPSNFASYIRLVDPTRNVDREVKIWMNHPLTYPSLQGETFYQQQFQPGDKTTVLEVTHNPFWPLPYIGLALGLAGMIAHFGMNLSSFLRRRSAAMAAVPPPIPAKGKSRVPARSPAPALTSYTLEPRSRAGSWLAFLLGAAICAAFFGIVLAMPVEPENGFDLAAFSRLPVSFGGRPMPMDTLADIGLKVVSGRESFTDPNDKEKHLPAIRWLADTLTDAPAAFDQKVIRIDDPAILTRLSL